MTRRCFYLFGLSILLGAGCGSTTGAAPRSAGTDSKPARFNPLNPVAEGCLEMQAIHLVLGEATEATVRCERGLGGGFSLPKWGSYKAKLSVGTSGAVANVMIDPAPTPEDAPAVQCWEEALRGSSFPACDAITTVTATWGAPVVKSCFPREKVKEIIVSRRQEVLGCYERQLSEDPELEGRLVTRFRIQADGSVGRVEAIEDELGSAKLKACVVDTMLQWTFPSCGTGIADIVYPWIFKSAPQG